MSSRPARATYQALGVTIKQKKNMSGAEDWGKDLGVGLTYSISAFLPFALLGFCFYHKYLFVKEESGI